MLYGTHSYTEMNRYQNSEVKGHFQLPQPFWRARNQQKLILTAGEGRTLVLVKEFKKAKHFQVDRCSTELRQKTQSWAFQHAFVLRTEILHGHIYKLFKT